MKARNRNQKTNMENVIEALGEAGEFVWDADEEGWSFNDGQLRETPSGSVIVAFHLGTCPCCVVKIVKILEDFDIQYIGGLTYRRDNIIEDDRLYKHAAATLAYAQDLINSCADKVIEQAEYGVLSAEADDH